MSLAVTQSPFDKLLKRKRGQSSPTYSPQQLPLQNTTETRADYESPSIENLSPSEWSSHLSSPADPSGAESANAQATGRPSGAELSQASSRTIDSHPVPDHEQQATHSRQSKPAIDMSAVALHNAIESQFDLEILLKHRELRLIEQELGKCQVAYEQLRRCHVIPYPAHSSSFDDMLSVASASGQPYRNSVSNAPPWGVTEGPYSRHYNNWLITDSSFDESFVDDAPTISTTGKRLPNRITRGVNADKGIFGPQARLRGGPGTPHMQALPHGYPEVKQDNRLVLVNRKSDGHMVKLACVDCKRTNFNSVQGFINHCRIAHARQFASHDQAIEASGQKFDGDDAYGAAVETNSPRGPATAGLVHPMIRAARPPSPEPQTPSFRVKEHFQANTFSAIGAHDSHASLTSKQRFLAETPFATFKPSPQTPYLSSLFSRLGRGDDLNDMVANAKKRDEINLIEAIDADESSDDDEPEEPAPQSRSTRGIAPSAVRPVSSGSQRSTVATGTHPVAQHDVAQPASRVHATVQTPIYTANNSFDRPTLDRDGFMTNVSTPSNLSPNTTDPYPAPSLVSDDGDFDNTHSESESSSHMDVDEEPDHYLHPHFVDHEDLDLGDHNNFDFAQAGKAHRPDVGRCSQNLTGTQDESPTYRHVTFASPVRVIRRTSKSTAD